MTERRLKVLLICNYEPFNAATVCDHINAFHSCSRHEMVVFSHIVRNGGLLPNDVSLDIFDAVILHYSVFLAVDAYVSAQTRRRLKQYAGIKAIFLQDEYRFVDASIARIQDIGFHVIFTCVPTDAIERVYPAERLPGVRRINVLTGYVPHWLTLYPPIELSKRKYDVSYRGRVYPAWHGRLGMEKWQIAERFDADAKRFGLKTNIKVQEKDRVYGAHWVQLLQDSRAVLGVESGASVFDFSGLVSAKVDTVVALRGQDKADYNTLRKRYFEDLEDQIPLAQISPRVFEAVALRTMCVLYEGEYSNVIEPWRHYVPLKKDHSNMRQVVDVLRDLDRVAEITANAYAEVALNPVYSYSTFVGRVDDILSEVAQEAMRHGSANVASGDACVNNSLAEEQAWPAIEYIRRHYPFKFTTNPHVLQSVTPRFGVRAVRLVRRYMPRFLMNRIRAILRSV